MPTPVPTPTVTVFVPSPVPIPVPVVGPKGGLDWGNVPQWVSGVLSGLSVLAVFYVILRDRRNRRREQMSQLIVRWDQDRRAKREYEDNIVLTNRSKSD